MEKEIISILVFSKRIGVNEKTIRRAIELGKIDKGIDRSGKKPKIIYDIALKEVEEMGIGLKSKSLRIDKQLTPDNKNTDVDTDDDIPEVFGDAEQLKALTVETASYQESRRRQAFYDSELSRLEFEQKEGSLVRKDDVYKELFDFGSEIRTRLLSIPDRITDELISLSDDRNAFYNLFYGNLRDALELLSKTETMLGK